MPHGQGTATYRDGHVYHGGWKEGAEHVQGTFTLTLSDVSKYVGLFKNNLPNGHGTYTFADGRIVKKAGRQRCVGIQKLIGCRRLSGVLSRQGCSKVDCSTTKAA